MEGSASLPVMDPNTDFRLKAYENKYERTARSRRERLFIFYGTEKSLKTDLFRSLFIDSNLLKSPFSP